MTTIQALIMAILQGVTELFPISSLGHAVILPALLHWSLDERAITFLPFLAMLHVGTATALFAYFWRDWVALLTGAVGAADRLRVGESRYILFLIVIATVPALVVGKLLEHPLRALFGTPVMAAGFLVINGLILLFADRLRSRLPEEADRPIASLSIADALWIGCWQCLAFLPGISRSGATMTGGLLRGVSHETAARFSFLIALPVILAATANQLLALHKNHIPFSAMGSAVTGAVVAGITAFLSTAFLMRYFRNHENWALRPFALYSVAAGILAIVALHYA